MAIQVSYSQLPRRAQISFGLDISACEVSARENVCRPHSCSCAVEVVRGPVVPFHALLIRAVVVHELVQHPSRDDVYLSFAKKLHKLRRLIVTASSSSVASEMTAT